MAAGTVNVTYAKKNASGYDSPVSEEPIDNGTYKVYLSVAGGLNFTKTDGDGLAVCEFTISKKDITNYNSGSNVNFDYSKVDLGVYDGSEKTSDEFSLSYTPAADKIDDLLDSANTSVNWTNNINATTDDIKATLTIEAIETSNYSGSIVRYFEIEKYNDYSDIADAFDFSIPGGDSAELTFDFEGHPVEVVLSDKYNGKELGQDDACGDLEVKYQKENTSGGWDAASLDEPLNAGTYRVLLNVEGGTNFASLSNCCLGQFSILPQDLGDAFSVVIDVSRVDLGSYDGTPKTSNDFDVIYKLHNLVAGEQGDTSSYDFYYEWENVTNASHAGGYSESPNIPKLTIYAGNSGNFKNSQCVEGTLKPGDPLIVKKYNNGVTDKYAFNVVLPGDDGRVLFDYQPHTASIQLKDDLYDYKGDFNYCYTACNSSADYWKNFNIESLWNHGRYDIYLNYQPGINDNFAGVANLLVGTIMVESVSLNNTDVQISDSSSLDNDSNSNVQITYKDHVLESGKDYIEKIQTFHNWSTGQDEKIIRIDAYNKNFNGTYIKKLS